MKTSNLCSSLLIIAVIVVNSVLCLSDNWESHPYKYDKTTLLSLTPDNPVKPLLLYDSTDGTENYAVHVDGVDSNKTDAEPKVSSGSTSRSNPRPMFRHRGRRVGVRARCRRRGMRTPLPTLQHLSLIM